MANATATTISTGRCGSSASRLPAAMASPTWTANAAATPVKTQVGRYRPEDQARECGLVRQLGQEDDGKDGCGDRQAHPEGLLIRSRRAVRPRKKREGHPARACGYGLKVSLKPHGSRAPGPG